MQQWYIGQYIGHIAAGCLAMFPAVSEHTEKTQSNKRKWIKYLKLKKKQDVRNSKWQKFKMADIVRDYT